MENINKEKEKKSEEELYFKVDFGDPDYFRDPDYQKAIYEDI